MKRNLSFLVIALFCLILGGTAHATLWDRGGGLIYDDILNITWLQDANFAKTSGVNADGMIRDWPDANSWVESLSYGGYEDWRLPKNLPINGSAYDYNTMTYDGTTDWGFNTSAPGTAYQGSPSSELAYMFYNNLGNVSYYDTSGSSPQSGWSPTPNATFVDGNGNTVSFINLQAGIDTSGIMDFYWSSPPFLAQLFGDQECAAVFDFYFGGQTYAFTLDQLDRKFVWAVRDGDSAAPVPEPTSMLLLASGLVGLAGFRKKFSKR